MGSDRYHRAARDGYLEALKEGTRRDLNSRDEDGMTPTLWAAFEGHLDALRLIVGRGGDPDKCDNYGNTALHFASAKGHINCVSFLINFGVNMWALDIDFHTPKDLAAINSKEQVLRFLDAAFAKEESKDRKRVKVLQLKAEKDAEKRIKEFDKSQKKASKNLQDQMKKLTKKEKMTVTDGSISSESSSTGTLSTLSIGHKSHHNVPSSTPCHSSRSSPSPKFSEIVSTNKNCGGTLMSKLKSTHLSGVYKKVQQRKTVSGGPTSGPDFKITEIEENGRRSLRSLSGVRRDNEVMYAPKYGSPCNQNGRRGRINGLFDDTIGCGTNSNAIGSLIRSISQPDLIHELNDEDDIMNRLKRDSSEDDSGGGRSTRTSSLFERPGFGSVAFRNSVPVPNFNKLKIEDRHFGRKRSKDNFYQRSEVIQHEMDLLEEQNPSEDEDDDPECGPIELLLVAAGIPNYIPIFLKENIDLDALILLTDSDLTSLGIPLGPRRKLLQSIAERVKCLKNPGELIDSSL